MTKTLCTYGVVLLAGALFLSLPGCSKKTLQSGGETTQASPPGKGGSPDNFGFAGGGESSKSGVGNFPETTMQSSSSGGLRGLDKNPSEERLASAEERFGNADERLGNVDERLGNTGERLGSSEERLGSGTMLAKADPSGSAGRQLEEVRAEQAASMAAGLRDVFFGYDAWTISEEGRQALSRDAEWMKRNPAAQIKVEGHCDERGTSDYNLVLGEKRAKAVRNYLVELGVGVNRLSVVSYGKERPFCQEHAESCYQQNRRGHLVLKSGK